MLLALMLTCSSFALFAASKLAVTSLLCEYHTNLIGIDVAKPKLSPLEGQHLVAPSEPFDETYAHKPWVVKWKGVVYHFYCATGTNGRVIAVATSKDLRK